MPEPLAKILIETELRYTNFQKNSNKFYRLTLRDDNSIQFQWGRIGNRPQSQIKHYNGLHNIAQHHYQAKLDEKLKKGYQIYRHDEFDSPSPKTSTMNKKNYKIVETSELYYD